MCGAVSVGWGLWQGQESKAGQLAGTSAAVGGDEGLYLLMSALPITELHEGLYRLMSAHPITELHKGLYLLMFSRGTRFRSMWFRVHLVLTLTLTLGDH